MNWIENPIRKELATTLSYYIGRNWVSQVENKAYVWKKYCYISSIMVELNKQILKMLRIIGIMFVVGVLVLIRQCMSSKKLKFIMNIVYGVITAFLSVSATMAFAGLKKINHGDYAPENAVYLQQMDIGSATMYVAALVMISLVITSIVGIVKYRKFK